ncbi:MAG TPA: tetratricopeptide repeat protein [Thioalkalivibrio sp.]|nr:tetratricopeptide repeat protein [Thioalkalivibrio sp.]
MGAAYVVVAWLVIQVVETIFPAFGFGDVAVRYTTIVFAIGFIPALIFAWAFELTPEGLKKESEVDRSQSVTPQTGKKLDRAIMVVLALGLAFFAFDKFVLSESRVTSIAEQARQAGRTEALVESYGDKSIAVLAFDDMSQAGDQEYLSDGIAEELLNLLPKIPELRVISRSSAFSFKGKDLPLTEIAQQLNVAHILEGSVRKAGNRVRITAQLIDARSDTHLWSETYDRMLDDVFAIQDDIAATVVEQLKVTLLGEPPQVRETDPAAYALYLQTRHLFRQGTAEGYEQSIALLEQVLAIDPEYADAWSALAANYLSQANFGLRRAAEAYALARAALEQALSVYPDHALAHASLGWIAMRYDGDLAQSARHLQRALALDPANHIVIATGAALLRSLGRLDEAVMLDGYVVSRDPVNPISHCNLASSLLRAGRWDEAIAANQTCLRLSPGRLFAHAGIGTALLMKGEAEAALEAFERERAEDVRAGRMSMALHTLGRQVEYEARLREAIELSGNERPSAVAEIYAWMGEVEEAFRWLGQAIQIEQSGLSGIGSWPLLAGLHDDPRWLPLLESIGQSHEQLAAIKFEVKLPGQ